MNTQLISHTGQMIELCLEYLSVRCIWLCVFIMSRTPFRVNPHFKVAWMLRNVWLVWLNCWVFVYELRGFGFESSCSHLNLRYHVCFEQGVPWDSGNYKVWIHSETRTWHGKNRVKCTVEPNVQSQKRTVKHLEHSSIIWPVWLNGWVFVHKLSNCGFTSSCSHLRKVF